MQEPAITPPSYAAEQRRHAQAAPLQDPRQPERKGGFLSLFGGGRQAPAAPPPARPAAPPPAARAAASGGAMAQPVQEAQPDSTEDLDIPSFLRRLAN